MMRTSTHAAKESPGRRLDAAGGRPGAVAALLALLRALGMEAAFDRRRADFSRLSDRALEDELYVHWVRQKTYVQEDEEGTTAAAATGVGMGPTSVRPTFRVDRPFLLALRERLSGTLLFLGKVVDPTAEGGDG